MEAPVRLTREENARYVRQMILQEFGDHKQEALRASRILVVGAGGLGSPVISYLAGAGVGTLGIFDDDRLHVSNLHRQTIYRTNDVGRPKVEKAAEFVAALNPHVTVVQHAERVDLSNAQLVISQYDLVVDGTDNIATRRVVAAAASDEGKPLVVGAVFALDGLLSVFMPRPGEMPDGFDFAFPGGFDESDVPACEINGVLGAVTGVIGTLMAMEAIKVITGVGDPLVGRLLLYEGKSARFTELRL